MKDPNISKLKMTASLALFSLFAVVVAPAASITWNATGTFTDNSVLALTGAVSNEVYGVDFGGSGAQSTANGYSFDDYGNGNVAVAGGGFGLYGGYLGGGGSSGDGALDTLLTYGFYGSSANTGTLNNLTVGQNYTVLALLADTRGTPTAGTAFFATDGISHSPDQVEAFTGGTPALGGYILGTFTADAPTQAYSLVTQNTVGSYVNSQYNVILLAKAPRSPVPLPHLITNTVPAFAAAGAGSQIVFTASFSNSPPVSLQWEFLAGGATNPINTGVVNVTNLGLVTSSLTLSNLQVAEAGSYRVKAYNATNHSGVVYSLLAPLTVTPLISWVGAGAFTDNTVLALAGAASNEVYGVDFGGSGSQTTDNGYTFDDYGDGNMSIAGSGFGLFGGYLDGGGTTGDGALDILLTYGLFGSSANTGILNNLTVGQTYTVLALLADTRGTPTAGTAFYGTEGVTNSPAQVEAFTGGSPAVGGYILGTFTAQTTNEPLSLVTQDVAGDYINCQYNVILLEKVTVTTPPVLGTPKILGKNLVLTGTGGTPMSGYTVLTATNLAIPLANWTVGVTGTLDNTGAFSTVIPISATNRARFFRVRMP